MKEPYPFLPLWRIKQRGLLREGNGLLPKEVLGDLDSIQEFSVGPLTLLPQSGEALLGSSRQCLIGKSHLFWFRRMQLQLATHDHNTGRPDCLWYGVGLKNNSHEVGFRVFADQSIKAGI